jgi:hypothetical protein
MYLIDNSAYDPVVELYLGLSPPCPDGTNISQRAINISSKYIIPEKKCDFKMNGSYIHPDYRSTGLH